MILLLTLCCVATKGNNADARLIHSWTEAELKKKSDLIVIAVPLVTADAQRPMPDLMQKQFHKYQFPSVDTMLKVVKRIKGNCSQQTIVVHHYRIGNVVPINAPNFMELFPKQQYLLYLIKDGKDAYAPVSGQIDSSQSARLQQ